MPTIAWDERVLDAVASAKDVTAEHFESVCKIAVLVFHAEKQSKRRLTRTASATGWSHEQTESVVLAVAKILMDAAKAELTSSQLRASLKGMAMSTEHADILVQLFEAHSDMIKQNSSRATELNIPQYRSLDWRVDLEIANRMTRNEPKPIVTLALNTSAAGDDGIPKLATDCFRVDYTVLKKMQTQLETALKEADSVHATRMQRYLH